MLSKSYMRFQLVLTKVLENNYYFPLKEKETVKSGVSLKSLNSKLTAGVFKTERVYWAYSFYPLTPEKRLLKGNHPVCHK